MPGTTENTNVETQPNVQTPNTAPDADMVAKLVAEGVEAQLKEIKEKLNNAYSARDAAAAKTKELETAAREAELARLTAEGKHQEVLEARLAEERAAREELQTQNTELSRNIVVKDALSGLQFRNERASEMAYKEIVGQLVRNDKNEWVHRSGVAIKDFVAAFANDEAQSFLFKVKANNGSGSTTGTNTTITQNKSLFEMSQDEVIKLAQEGKLPKARK